MRFGHELLLPRANCFYLHTYTWEKGLTDRDSEKSCYDCRHAGARKHASGALHHLDPQLIQLLMAMARRCSPPIRTRSTCRARGAQTLQQTEPSGSEHHV